MSLLLGFDPAGLPAKVASTFDDLVASLQVWAGNVEAAGRWTEVPYESSLFFASAGVWTVDQGDMIMYRYSVQQDVMHLNIFLDATATSAGMGPNLYIRLPSNYRVRPGVGCCGVAAWDGGAAVPPGLVWSGETSGADQSLNNTVRLLRDFASVASTTNWPSSSTIYFRISATVPVFRV